MTNSIKIFKLNYSGAFEEVPKENLVKSFNLFDILTFYIPDQKRLYIWIGKKASHSLKSHISKLRELITRDHPEFKILRNITVESGSEPQEFLEKISVSDVELHKHIRQLETKLLPIISEINRLKTEADKLFLSEEFGKAVHTAEKILNLSKEIDDESLGMDQINFINELKSRTKAKEILQEIEQDCIQVLEKFQQLIDNEDYKEAHHIVENLKQKYKDDYNILLIPKFQELVLKDENMLNHLRKKQDKLKRDLDDLEFKFNQFLKEGYLGKASNILNDIKKIIPELIEKSTSSKWNFLESSLVDAKKALINRSVKFSKDALNNLDKGKISEALELFEKIIGDLESSIE